MSEDFLAGADIPPVVFRLRHRDGSWRHLGCVASNRLGDPSIGGVVVNARDVTERVGAEEARRETSARLEALVRAAPLAVLGTDLDGTVRSWNPAAERIFGWTEQEAVGSFLPFVSPERVEEFRRLRDRLVNEGPLVEVELVRRRKDGEPLEVSLSAAPVRDASGTIVGIMSILVDIGERKAAERELARVTRQLEEAQRLAHVGSWEVDLITGATKWSPEMQALFGVEPGAPDPEFDYVLGCVHPEDRELAADRAQDAIKHGRSQQYEHRLLNPDGSVRWLAATIHVEPGENGRPVRMVGAAQDVTERKRAEEALAESLRRFRVLSDRAPVGIFETDPDGACVYVNESLSEIQGVSAEQIIGRAWVDTLFKDDVERVWLGWLGAVADSRPFRSEFRFRRPDGDLRWVVGTTVPLLDGRGELTGYLGTVTDITDRRRAEDELRETESRFRTLVEQTSGVIYIDRADASMETIYVSPRIQKVLGVSPEEYVGDPLCWERHIHEEDRDRALAGAAELVETDIDDNLLEYRWVRPDGRVVWIDDRGTKVRDVQGRLSVIQGVMFDVTERKRAEEALRETEAKYRALVEQIPAITYIDVIDPDIPGRVGQSYVSPQLGSMLGHTVEEIVADPDLWDRLIHPEDRELALGADAHHYVTGEPLDSQYRMIAADGRTLWVHDQAVIIRDETGRALYSQGVIFDVTERKRAEEALRETEAKFRALVEHVPAVTYMELADGEGTVAYISPQIESMLGFTQQDYTDDPRLWAKITHPDDLARVEEHDARTSETGESFGIEYRMIARDGRTVWIRDDAVLFRASSGEPAYWLGFMFDITERKAAEEILRESAAELERSLEVLRAADAERRDLVAGLLEAEDVERVRMAEGIEDEQIQHMAAVGIRLETLRRGLTDPAQLGAVDKLAETVQHAVGRLRTLLVELRPRALEQEGLGPALEQYVRTVAAAGAPEVRVEDRMTRQPALTARTTAYRIAQEAISNALRHAGASRIDVALGDLDDGVLVRVSDDGSGFDWAGAPGTEHRGLASMWERAEFAGGWLRIRTSAGTGTVVECWLPGEAAETGATAP